MFITQYLHKCFSVLWTIAGMKPCLHLGEPPGLSKHMALKDFVATDAISMFGTDGASVLLKFQPRPLICHGYHVVPCCI